MKLMPNDFNYECDLHKEFIEGLFNFVDEFSDKKPTKAAIARYLKKDASYIKADGSIGWHSDIVDRCDIATKEFVKQKKIKDDRKNKRNKSSIKKLTEKNEELQNALEKITERLNESLLREIDLFRALKKSEKELQGYKDNSMIAMSVNNDWRL